MPDEVEVETSELQETIDEIREEREERVREAKTTAWTRWISLTTALLAVIAAVAALKSGSLVNEAMLVQLRASDSWNEYQAAREKDHLYRISANVLLDSGAKLPEEAERPKPRKPRIGNNEEPMVALKPDARLAQYVGKIGDEVGKEANLKDKATDLEKEAEDKMRRHHIFAYAVTFTQVAIALSAVAALTRRRPVWYFSMLIGVAGLAWFAIGVITK